MNNQSDYGYEIGQLDDRSPASCFARADQCDQLALETKYGPAFQDQMRRFAVEWREEAARALGMRY